jgi:hypothetical protein
VNDAIAGLRLLRRYGFGGRRVFGDGGNTMTLHYRRTWHGVSDVVLVYAEDDAEGYRTDDVLNDTRPFDLASHAGLQEEVIGTVCEVVDAVLSWSDPECWPSQLP